MKVSEELGQIILNPASFVDQALIDRTYEAIRKTTPLSQLALPGFDPMWIVSLHQHVADVSRRNNDFHSGERSATLMPLEAEAAIRNARGGSNNLIRSLIQMDPPDHGPHRLVAMPALTPQQVATMLDKVRVIARKYVSRMLSSDGQIDFASEVAFLYPLEVIMTIVGVPEQDHAKMLTWTQWLFDSADPDLRRPGPYPQSAGQAVAELDEVVKLFSDYYLALAADRRAHPRNDLATTLSLATLDGQLMGDYELASYFIITATAGHDTTAASIATGMAQLAATPALLGALKNTPDLLPGFVDESVRWATPVKHFIRSATQDTMLGDTSIRKGDLLFLAYPSANRDEAVFADPFKFDVTRKPNRHVGFGYGAHVCIGQHLAKAEMRIFWEELLPHLDEISLRAPVQMIASNFVSGPKAVPIRFKQV